MPALYSDALLAMGPEVQRLIADLDAANQHRQALLHDLEAQGDRADAVEALVEIHEAIARAALAVVTRGTPVTLAELMPAVDVRISRELVRERAVTARLAKQVEALLLDRQRETREANDRIRSWTAQHLDALTTELVHAQLDALRAKHATRSSSGGSPTRGRTS